MRLALPRWSPYALAGLSAGLLLACAAAPSLFPTGRSDDADRMRAALDLELPQGAGAWWTTVLLLLVGAAGWGRAEQSRGLGQRADARRWGVFAALLAWACFDHAVRAHVAVARLAAHLSPGLGRVEPLSLVLAVVAAAVWLPLVRRARQSLRSAAVLASVLVVVGDVAVDVVVSVAGLHQHVLGSTLVEAACTWGGLVLLLAVLGRPGPWTSTSTSDATAARGADWASRTPPG